MAGVRIVGDIRQLQAKLKRMQVFKVRPIAAKVGEALVSSTIRRFDEQRDPSGKAWKPLAVATVLGSLSKKDFTKRGRLRKRAEERLQGRKILIQSARLRNSISSRVSGFKVAVGTNVVYGRIHQFGGKAGWGKRVVIPARPFLGISEADLAEIDRIVREEVGLV